MCVRRRPKGSAGTMRSRSHVRGTRLGSRDEEVRDRFLPVVTPFKFTFSRGGASPSPSDSSSLRSGASITDPRDLFLFQKCNIRNF